MAYSEIFGPVGGDDPTNLAHLPAAFDSTLATTRMWKIRGGTRMSFAVHILGVHNGVEISFQWAPYYNLFGYAPAAAPATAKDFSTIYTPTLTTDTDWWLGTSPFTGTGGTGGQPNLMQLASGQQGRYLIDSTMMGVASSITTDTMLMQHPRGAGWLRTRVRKMGATAPTTLRIVMITDDLNRSV